MKISPIVLIAAITAAALATPVAAQVIARPAAPASASKARPAPDPARWQSPALAFSWERAQRIEGDREACFQLLAGIAGELAERGHLDEAVAVAGRIEGLQRYLLDAGLARRAAQAAQLDLARRLYTEARGGLAFADLGGAQQLQIVLAGAAAALGMSEEVTHLLESISDQEHLADALGQVLAAGRGRPADDPATAARLDELSSEKDSKFFNARLLQARALLHIARAWRSSEAGIDADLLAVLAERAARLADNKLIPMTGHFTGLAEFLHDAGLRSQAEAALELARRHAAAGGGFEHGPTDLIELARVEKKITGLSTDAEREAAARDLLAEMDAIMKTEAAAAAGAAFWRAQQPRQAREFWLAAVGAVAGNPNNDLIHESLARVALEAARCGAGRHPSWDDLERELRELDERASATPGEEGA